MKKKKLHGFDSDEEWYFSFYLDELYEAGYISEYELYPDSYILSDAVFYEYEKQLKTKTKMIVKKLMREHIYSPDFRIIWADKARGVFFDSIYGQTNLLKVPFITISDNISIVEIKPVFDQNNMTRLFITNQKWMYHKLGIYVQKIVPVKLFEQTFTPKRYLLTDKSGKPRKLKYQPRSLETFVKT